MWLVCPGNISCMAHEVLQTLMLSMKFGGPALSSMCSALPDRKQSCLNATVGEACDRLPQQQTTKGEQ